MIKSIKVRIVKILYKFGYKQNKLGGVNLRTRIKHLTIYGTNNEVLIKSKLGKDVRIVIYGSNHKLVIDKHVTFKKGLIWFEDNNCTISIGSGTTIEEATLSVAEDNHSITIGEDCMISKGIRMATSDAHSIIDSQTQSRINPAADIVVHNHVWIGNGTYINKGCEIGENTIIGGKSVVTKSIPSGVVAVGTPAKVVKQDVTWDRKRL